MISDEVPIRSVAVLLFLLAITSAWADSPAPPPLGRLVDVGGYRVHIFCEGTGSPTVVIVGGGFSFDWGLVQPKAAESTRVCTYDPSGTAWSDRTSGTPTCRERIAELHRLLTNASVNGPYVLVGFSIGGLFARLYANTYPKQVVGAVIVDHAFLDAGERSVGLPADSVSLGQADAPPVLLSETPIVLGIEDDENFGKLPRLDRDLHTWAMSAHPVRPTAEMAAECFETVATATKNVAYPLGDIPLVVISTLNKSPNYDELQKKLLSLSRESRQRLAENSTHMVIVDEPEVVVRAIEEVVGEVRDLGKP